MRRRHIRTSLRKRARERKRNRDASNALTAAAVGLAMVILKTEASAHVGSAGAMVRSMREFKLKTAEDFTRENADYVAFHDAAAPVAALFVRHNSIYKTMVGVDAWDAERDARNWEGGCPIVAHPPCAQWGTLSHMSKNNPAEKALARLAVSLIRIWGGVLEHPVRSKLWKDMHLPADHRPDYYGGWTLTVSQKWWGHRAEKKTHLYICGCKPENIPAIPYSMGQATHICAGGAAATAREAKRRRQAAPEWRRPSISHAEREHTPPAFAAWLVELARRCSQPLGAA